ncbi:MAG: hypothetical protein ABJE95_21465 [Byssovorax sp.]
MPIKLKRGVSIEPLARGVAAFGAPLAHGKVTAFRPGTSTPAPLWKTIDKSVPWDGPWGNVVTLDAEGRADAYGDGLYTLELCDEGGSLVDTWEPLFFGHAVVNARDFGAVGAGDASIEKDTDALQEAIDYCVATGAKLFIPAGMYKLTRSLAIHRLVKSDAEGPRSFAACSVEILGERRASGIQGNDTVLVATFGDRPALWMQGVRGVVLSRLAFEGLNNYSLTGDYRELLDDATFTAPGCRDGDRRAPLGIDNAFCSPYAAIAVDPFPGGGLPADGGYPELENHYYRGSRPSRGITIEQCAFYRFVVGVAIAPAGGGAPPEDIRISDSTFEQHKISIATGLGTSANVTVRNVRSFGNLFFLSTLTYGDGEPGYDVPSIGGANVGATKYLFLVDAGAKPAVFEGIACASTLGLGFLHASGSKAGASFTLVGSNFDFAETQPAIDTHLWAPASVRFVGCTFASYSHALPIRFMNLGQLAFSSCSFLNITADVDSITEPSQIGFVGFEELSRVTFEECDAGDRSLPDQLVYLERVYRTSRIAALDRSIMPPGSMIIAADLSGGLLRVSSEVKAIRMFGVTVKSDRERPGEASFFAPDPSILKPGDLVFARNPGWIPESYTEPRASNGVCGVIAAIDDGMVRMTSVVRGLGDGVHDLSVRYFPRFHLPSTGMTTAGSQVITRVSSAETWRQFDRISGGGIPLGAYITHPVALGATRIRISKPATSTSARPIRLYDADIERFGDPIDASRRGEFEAPPSTKRTSQILCEGGSPP